MLQYPRTSQPQQLVGINQSNPITQGIVFSIPGNTGRKLWDFSGYNRNSSFISSTNVTPTVGVNGNQLTFDGSQISGSVSFSSDSFLTGLTTASIEIDFIITASNDSKLFGKWGGANWTFLVQVNTSGAVIYAVQDSGGTRVWQSSNSVITTNTRYHLIISWSGSTNATFTLNGTPYTFPTKPSSCGAMASSNSTFQLGRDNTAVGGSVFTGSIGMVNMWNRPLSQLEMKQRYVDRWGIFAPAPRKYFGFSTGANVYNESFTETVTVADSLAATATAVVSITESVAATDSLAAAVTVNASQTETVAMADSLAAAATINVTQTDSIAAGDTITGSVTASVSFTESITAGDSIAESAVISVSLAESVTPFDSLLATAVINTAFTDSVALADYMDDNPPQPITTTDIWVKLRSFTERRRF